VASELDLSGPLTTSGPTKKKEEHDECSGRDALSYLAVAMTRVTPGKFPTADLRNGITDHPLGFRTQQTMQQIRKPE